MSVSSPSSWPFVHVTEVGDAVGDRDGELGATDGEDVGRTVAIDGAGVDLGKVAVYTGRRVGDAVGGSVGGVSVGLRVGTKHGKHEKLEG